MGNATDVLKKRKKFGPSYYSIENDTSKSIQSASDILNNRKVNKYRSKLQSINIKALYDSNEFGLSEEKKIEYKTKLSDYKSALENLKKYDSSISDNDYNDYVKSLDSLSNKFDVLSQFKTEDEYNSYINALKDREDMSEPTLSANILMDAGFQFNLEKRRTGSAKLAWQKTGKYIGKTVAVYSISQIIVALAEALADAYRDDDDEKFMAKFGEAFKENAISDLNPFNKIPLIADVSDLIFSFFGIGFSSSNSLYLQALDEASKAFDIWKNVINGKGGETVYAGIYSTTKLLSYITGASASGAMREVVTLWNNTVGAADPYLKIRTYESSATDKSIAEYYFDKGDTVAVKAAVSKMVEDKIKSGKTEKEAKSAVRSSFTSTYKAEYTAAVESKDYNERNRIRKFLYATGIYGSLSELDGTLAKWLKDSEDE